MADFEGQIRDIRFEDGSDTDELVGLQREPWDIVIDCGEGDRIGRPPRIILRGPDGSEVEARFKIDMGNALIVLERTGPGPSGDDESFVVDVVVGEHGVHVSPAYNEAEWGVLEITDATPPSMAKDSAHIRAAAARRKATRAKERGEGEEAAEIDAATMRP
jgi:hypothetical protein